MGNYFNTLSLSQKLDQLSKKNIIKKNKKLEYFLTGQGILN